MTMLSQYIETIRNAKEYHIAEDYTYIGHTSGKLVNFEFVILKIGKYSESLHRYLLEVERSGKIEKYFYYIDHDIPEMIGKNIYFERKHIDNADVSEMLHISRCW
ncbi:hypothetical protein H5A20_02175 [Pectobacterium brasiliense]|uniref:hypothetical protein n=1 Tax=Pectobacterium brasiliense TaxID=180957 RepID=UPI001969346F|nr:hypothetical protein [Pectobacterium brasiliense]MBN3197511.1 hypothetical protein [Pectobacterium brasiliense]